MCMFYSIDTLLSCVDDGPEGSECSMETPGDHQDKYNTENEKDSMHQVKITQDIA